MEPNNVTALNRKGEVLSKLGKTDEDKYYKAIESYDEGRNLEPNNVTALNGKGEVLSKWVKRMKINTIRL